MFLGVDVWPSPNGFDILKTVIYWLSEIDGAKPSLKAMPLDFIKLSKSCTGEYLAESVQMIVEKFEIETKVHTQLIILSSLVLIYEIFLIFQIFDIVSNNASNNSSSCPTSRASLTGFDVLHMSSI